MRDYNVSISVSWMCSSIMHILCRLTHAPTQLAARDLDSILPREINPNPYGGPYTELMYNENDVAQLAGNLNAVLFTDTSANAPLAARSGQEISRFEAMNVYRVSSFK